MGGQKERERDFVVVGGGGYVLGRAGRLCTGAGGLSSRGLGG